MPHGNENVNNRNISQEMKTMNQGEQSAQSNIQAFETPGKSRTSPCTKTSPGDKKFSGRCRLYVGNLPSNITQKDFEKIFEPYGETSDIYLNPQKCFGFIKLTTREIAEKAKSELDGTRKSGKTLRVNFAASGTAIKVKKLPPWITNERLHNYFSIFGDIERAVVFANDKGHSLGEGIVEFAKKNSASNAVKRCTRDCFLIGNSTRPVAVEMFETRDEEEGFSEKIFTRNNPHFLEDREAYPRFTQPGTFEHEHASRWKQLYAIEAQKRELLEKELLDAQHKLEEEMEQEFYEQEANAIREKIRFLEEQVELKKKEKPQQMDADRKFDDEIKKTELELRQMEEEILRPRVVRNSAGVVQRPEVKQEYGSQVWSSEPEVAQQGYGNQQMFANQQFHGENQSYGNAQVYGQQQTFGNQPYGNYQAYGQINEDQQVYGKRPFPELERPENAKRRRRHPPM